MKPTKKKEGDREIRWKVNQAEDGSEVTGEGCLVLARVAAVEQIDGWWSSTG
jgi:hypothetical protein